MKLCLNPSCSGVWSLTIGLTFVFQSSISLNPSCSGVWSLTNHVSRSFHIPYVLILLVVEYGL